MLCYVVEVRSKKHQCLHDLIVIFTNFPFYSGNVSYTQLIGYFFILNFPLIFPCLAYQHNFLVSQFIPFFPDHIPPCITMGTQQISWYAYWLLWMHSIAIFHFYYVRLLRILWKVYVKTQLNSAVGLWKSYHSLLNERRWLTQSAVILLPTDPKNNLFSYKLSSIVCTRGRTKHINQTTDGHSHFQGSNTLIYICIFISSLLQKNEINYVGTCIIFDDTLVWIAAGYTWASLYWAMPLLR